MKTLIQQRTDDDCVICCVAMATSTTYEDVQYFKKNIILKSGIDLGEGQGNTLFDFIPYMLEHSYTMGFVFNAKEPVSLEGVECFEFTGELKRPAFITVPSTRFPGKLHQIYFNGEKVYDPSPNYKTHPELAELEITEWVAINYHMGRMKRIVKQWKGRL
ncbi:hypothetical protein KAR91_30795 [Candidatus Pacearchaeota archaeon]|nr:hypothetical protein [Candidatus Pacearchaeota archaeon]